MKLIESSIGEYADKVFEKYRNKEAIVYINDSRRITYDELWKKVICFSKVLISMGIKKGDFIALCASNSPEWIIAMLSCFKIGAVVCCFNSNSTAKQLDYLINQGDFKVFIKDDEINIDSIKLRSKCRLIEISSILNMEFESKTYWEIYNSANKINNGETDCEIYNSKNKINNGESNSEASNITNIGCNAEDNFGFPDVENIKFDGGSNYDISNERFLKIINQVSAYDTAAVLYTSGTTGNPKGVVFSHYAILNNILSHIDSFHYTDEERILNALPMYHILGGFGTSFTDLFAGASLILLKKFKTLMVLNALDVEKCTSFHGVPTMYKYLLNKCEYYDLSSMESGMIAGDSSTPELMQAVMDNLHIKFLHNAFGQTEALIIAANTITSNYNCGIDKAKVKSLRINAVGKPVDHVSIKIWDNVNNRELPCGISGEIIVKSPFMMKGYFNNPEETAKSLKNGWFHTGDIGKIDEDGYLYVKGRMKDIIIRGGENISPLEIQRVFLEYEKIQDACVFGVPDKLMGQEICAMIITKNCEIDEEDLRLYLSKNLPKGSIPKYIKFINQFPLTSTGKVKKDSLREIAVDSIK